MGHSCISVPKFLRVGWREGAIWGAILSCALSAPPAGQPVIRGRSQTQAPTPVNTEYAGDEACAACHLEIYETFQKTAMARASGPIAGNVIPGWFAHRLSRVRYEIAESDGHVWLRFDRDGPEEIHGQRELKYFIGSGKLGRTYVFEENGFYFEAPVNWYGQKQEWDMTPAYQGTKRIPLNLPLRSSCVFCHAGVPREPEPGTNNRYESTLLTQPGIGCERCHGPGAAHALRRAQIVNPSKLAPERRDAVCMQCHLEGDAAILQPGKRLSSFRPGEDLQEYVHYLLLEQPSQQRRAASQFEGLAESKCKRSAGHALSCTTCHDPHFSPSETKKSGYYNQKCLACHLQGRPKAPKHLAVGRDCVTCHMPRLASSDIAHTQGTDHRILQRPAGELVQPEEASWQWRRFAEGDGKPTERDLALAWQGLATAGMEAAQLEADRFLKRALKEYPEDADLLSAAAFLLQKKKEVAAADAMEERALKANPLDNEIEANLGVLTAEAGDLARAEKLLRQAFQREPGASAIGMNLFKTLAAEGKFKEAAAVVKEVLEFNPDFPEAEKLMGALRRETQ